MWTDIVYLILQINTTCFSINLTIKETAIVKTTFTTTAESKTSNMEVNMNKFKKMMSVTLAGCMAASALMMSAGAVNTPVQQDNPNIVLNADWGKPGGMIDRHGVDWSKIDTSMCVSDKDYHFYPQNNTNIATQASIIGLIFGLAVWYPEKQWQCEYVRHPQCGCVNF